MLRKPKLGGDGHYPWNIRTFFAFAAAGEILLDLVILEIVRERRQETMDRSFRSRHFVGVPGSCHHCYYSGRLGDEIGRLT